MNTPPDTAGNLLPPGPRTRRQTSARVVALTALLVALGSMLSGSAGASTAQDDEDPALAQTIPADQQVATGEVELGAGHLDLGPAFVDGEWRLMFHDAAEQPAVWRHPEDVVLRVGDAGRVEVPPDDQYSFIGAAPGEPVWVVPQTENPGVVWLGWNTQNPEVMERVDRGIRLRLVGVDGPGKMSVYLQSGNLSGPEVLWESDTETTDPLWVEVNTHTHANWVFSAAGVYVLRLETVADLLDGTEVTDTVDVRVAVGDATPAAEATSASFLGVEAASSAPDNGEADQGSQTEQTVGSSAEEDEESNGNTTLLLLAGAALVLAAVVTFGVVRSRAARRSVERDRVGT